MLGSMGTKVVSNDNKIVSLKYKLSVRLQRCNYWSNKEKNEYVH